MSLAGRHRLATALLILGWASTSIGYSPLGMTVLVLSTIPLALLLYKGAAEGWNDRSRKTAFLLSVAPGVPAALLGVSFGGAPVAAQVMWGSGALGVLWWVSRIDLRPHPWIPVTVLLLFAGAVTAVTMTFSDFVLDVWFLHHDASANLFAGLSPYSGLSVINGAPTATPGETISGYPYPLVALLPFLAAFSAGVDVRIGLAFIWIFAGVLLVLAGRGRRTSLTATVALLLAAATPLNLWAAWTEPITVFLLVAAGAGWSYPVIGSFFLGLALSSKQYLVVLAPLLLSPVLSGRRRVMTIAVAFTGAVAGFVMDPGGYLDNAVLFHVSQPARADSLNLTGVLTGLGWTPPAIGAVAVAAGLWTAWKLHRRVASLAEWMRAASASLAITFLLAPQALTNYWFLVLCLVLLSVIFEQEPTPEPL